ncbi:MAG: hypothetical protein K2J93_05080, partial [Anaeroplasmataceae bacterium]|nr:hypothetical protein [Anaeroplasmataceae bacterium]
MKLFKKLILCGFACALPFTLFACKDNEQNTDDPGKNPGQTENPGGDKPGNDTPKVELKFKTAVLTTVEETSDLSIKASVNGEVGTIYAVLTDVDSTPTKEAIVAGGSSWEWEGNSGTTQALEATITDLDQGKEYFAFFVIKDGDNYSDIVKKSATTIEFVDKGEGTKENPFKVSTVEDLEHVGVGPYDKYELNWKAEDTYYVLVNDIDLTEKYGKDKESWDPLTLGKNGTFDGQGYTISGLYIDKESTVNLGLFSGINIGGTVKN